MVLALSWILYPRINKEHVYYNLSFAFYKQQQHQKKCLKDQKLTIVPRC